jgi:hypothetical protein
VTDIHLELSRLWYPDAWGAMAERATAIKRQSNAEHMRDKRTLDHGSRAAERARDRDRKRMAAQDPAVRERLRLRKREWRARKKAEASK